MMRIERSQIGEQRIVTSSRGKRQIGSLQRQAARRDLYQALLADLRTLDTHHSRKQLESLETELASCHTEIARLGESEKATRGKIDTAEKPTRRATPRAG